MNIIRRPNDWFLRVKRALRPKPQLKIVNHVCSRCGVVEGEWLGLTEPERLRAGLGFIEAAEVFKCGSCGTLDSCQRKDFIFERGEK